MAIVIDNLGKKAEQKIRDWLNRPEAGYSLDRIPDQMTGYLGSRNICDFDCYKYPNMYYIESKATGHDRFEFNQISDIQRNGLLAKSKIAHVKAGIIVLFAEAQRAFWIPITEIEKLEDSGKHSLNIKKIESWSIQYTEIQTIPSTRKKLLDYTGEIDNFI